MRYHLSLICLSSLLMAPTAWGSDPATDAMKSAYAPYRVALFRTNSKAQAESEAAIAKTQESWQALMDRFTRAPPPPYDRDARFALQLGQVATVFAKAESQIRDQRLADAHETLEQARDLLADLRRRNGVVVYSDHMNAYHEAMEHVLTDGPKALAASQGSLLVMAHVGTLEHLAARLRSEATVDVTGDPDFAPLLQAVQGSVASLRAAVLSQDPEAIRRAIAALKAPYSKLFLKFG